MPRNKDCKNGFLQAVVTRRKLFFLQDEVVEPERPSYHELAVARMWPIAV